MHSEAYDPADRFFDLAADRTVTVGCALIDAADAFHEAAIDCLEGWEDEYEAGDSLRRPSDFANVAALYKLSGEAAHLARAIAHRRALSFVLATAEAV